LLASNGIVFYGLENYWEEYNSALSVEMEHRQFNFTLLDEPRVQEIVKAFIDGSHNFPDSPFDYFPGLAALQVAYPQIDIIGVDWFRRAIRQSYSYVDYTHTEISSY